MLLIAMLEGNVSCTLSVCFLWEKETELYKEHQYNCRVNNRTDLVQAAMLFIFLLITAGKLVAKKKSFILLTAYTMLF